MSILLVEDEARVASFIQRGLMAEGHAVTVVATAADAVVMGCEPDVSVIILDLLLPDGNGNDVCVELRGRGVLTPILMLTAMDTLDDKVSGLDNGADDYLTKPFAFDELLARLNALIRRDRRFQDDRAVLQVGDIRLDRERMEVMRGGRLIELTSKELGLLELLMSRPGQVMSRSRILNTVWGLTADPLTNVVDVYIKRLRAKLAGSADDAPIRTVRGRGYALDVGRSDSALDVGRSDSTDR